MADLEMDDDYEEALLATKRHKELSGTLKTIAVSLSKDNDTKIVSAINNQTKAIERFVDAIKHIEKNEAPEVNIDVNQEKVISSLNVMGENILKGLAELKLTLDKEEKKEKKEWEFKVIRRERGYIDKIIATQK